MSFPPGVPGSLYATSVVQPVQQRPMMVQVAPVRHVTVLPVSTVVMRPVVASPIHTIAAPPRPQIIQTFSHIQQQAAVQAVQQQAAAQLTQKAEEAASAAAQNPPITVFVSNITERASDTLVRQILMKCGSVFGWKRVQGASGKLQAFGFCEYKEPESALRAIYLLHDFELGERKLRVKVDAKTQDILNKWKDTNSIKNGGAEAPPPNATEAKNGIDLLVKEYAAELNSSAPTEQTEKAATHKIEEPVVRESHNVEENLKELDLEEGKKDYISNEIRTFRTTQKQREEERKREDEIKKKIERERKEEDRQREKARQKEREDRDREEREKSRKDDRNRTPQKHRGSSRHSRSPPPRGSMRRSRTPPRLSRTRTPPRRRSRSRDIREFGSSRIRRSRSPRSPRRRDDDNEDDESHERRRMERKIREKEQAYQERLRAWEIRERRKKRDYEKRDEREALMRKEMMREAKRLQEFLADYDDLKMDPKYYTGGAMAKRRREWSREQESDSKDRKKEQEEIEALRHKLVEENHPDPETAIAKAIKETESVWQPLLKPDTPPPTQQKSPKKKENSSSSSSSSGSDSESDHEGKSASGSSDSEDESEDKSPKPRLVTANLIPVQDEPESAAVTVASMMTEVKREMVNSFEPIAQNGNESADDSDDVIRTEIVEQQEDSPGHFETQFQLDTVSQSSSLKNEPVMQLPGSNQRKKLKVSDVFNQDDDEEEVPKKRKLVPIEYSHEERNAMRSQEDKRKMVRALIEKIPTKKEDLFDYNLDWTMIDSSLMEKRIQPWITKKIVEYIGEEEPTLVEFICSKIMSKSPPERIYEDISMVLDDEAEVFVVKMWRLLIYETEAKKEGLSK